MKRRLPVRARKLLAGALVGAVVGALVAVGAYTRPLALERGELWTYDMRVRSAGSPVPRLSDIVIIDVGEQDIEDVENYLELSWPWPRALYGYITQYCAAAGAKAIIFDWLFQDRGQYSVSDAEELAGALRSAGNTVIGLALTRNEMVRRASEGRWAARLAELPTRAEAEKIAIVLMAWNVRSYLVGAGPTTLWYGGKKDAEDVLATWRRLTSIEELAPLFAPPGAAGDGSAEPPAPVPPEPRELTAAEHAAEFTAASIIAGRDSLAIEGAGAVHVPERSGMDPPLGVIAAAPARTGNVYQDNDADGIMRRHTPLVRHLGAMYPSLALAAYLVGHPEVTPRFDGQTLVLGDRRIPLDEEGRIPIRFHADRVYLHLPAYKVLQSQSQLLEHDPPLSPPPILRGKYVIIAAAGQALRDIRVTPVSRFQLGAEVQANALDNLLHGDVIRRVSRATDAAAGFALCVVIALALTALWSAIPRVSIALVAVAGTIAAGLGGYLALAFWLYESHGVWLAVAVPTGGAVMAGFAALLASVAIERRGRRFVQEALGRYTSSALVKELIENPGHLSLEWGERRGMSVYFSDIAGFTTISEALEPEQLVALLNDYLTAMTDLVLEHGGVVDKYIGDAIMAFWGAPLRDSDHARNAVRCALAMRKRCDELRPVWQERFGVEVLARAGINSGEAVVGNMGSRHKYNYTVMGDMVNLASRLEGANKPYGTFLMISETTAAGTGGAFDLRELDRIAVKGKDQPVVVYEVLEEAGRTPPEIARGVEIFLQGLARYRDREFKSAIEFFEQALAANPADGPSKTYIERCHHLLSEPPPADWDGVWRMKEK